MAALSQTKHQNWTLKSSPGPNEYPSGEKRGVTFGERTTRAKAWRREKCTWEAWQNQKEAFGGGQPRSRACIEEECGSGPDK